MTQYQFNGLSASEQAEIVWSGTHIGERFDEKHSILLYQIDSFYVEVFYHRDDNAIKRFRSFSSVNQLEPYLQKISLDGIR